MSNNLKPCPFCGGEAIVFDTGMHWDKMYYRVITKCHCCMQSRFYDTPQEAIEAWNTRADERPKGEWISGVDYLSEAINYRCSECGSELQTEEKLDFCFCPYCGAEMRKEKDNG